jgi:hypothetical protein
VLCEETSEIKAMLVYMKKVFVAMKEVTDKGNMNYLSFTRIEVHFYCVLST